MGKVRVLCSCVFAAASTVNAPLTACVAFESAAFGAGQFVCGSIDCAEKTDLRSWEVPFGYVEAGEKRLALVKVRLCPACSDKLNYRKQMREVKRAAAAAAGALAPTDDGGQRAAAVGDAGDAGPAPPVKRTRHHDGVSDATAPLQGAGQSAAGVGAAGEAVPAESTPARAHWRGSAAAATLDRTKDEELEDYFADLFQ